MSFTQQVRRCCLQQAGKLSPVCDTICMNVLFIAKNALFIAKNVLFIAPDKALTCNYTVL